MSNDKLTFSQREGLKPTLETADLVVNGITDEIRTAIWNVFQPKLLVKYFGGSDQPNSKSSSMLSVYKHLNWPVDQISYYWRDEVNKFREWFFTVATWNEVYDFAEYLANTNLKWYWATRSGNKMNYLSRQNIRNLMDEAFKKTFSGYRFVGDEILPMTDEMEIAEIQQAASISNEYLGARSHIKTAKTKLKEKDYRNCITESIHAVDSVLSVHSSNPKEGFNPKAKKFFKKFGNPHSQFDQALTNLYNYTSDEQGLRHPLIGKDDADVDFEDAKYF